MFMAGFSVDLNRFEKLLNRSIGFGIISYLFPAAGAYFMGVLFFSYSVATSLLIGAIVGLIRCRGGVSELRRLV